jgi:hypothetical protein
MAPEESASDVNSSKNSREVLRKANGISIVAVAPMNTRIAGSGVSGLGRPGRSRSITTNANLIK